MRHSRKTSRSAGKRNSEEQRAKNRAAATKSREKRVLEFKAMQKTITTLETDMCQLKKEMAHVMCRLGSVYSSCTCATDPWYEVFTEELGH